MRADQLLVARGLASTRSQAQRLVASGVDWRQGASANWRSVAKNGEELPENAELRIVDDAEQRYVSRGGLKLEAALEFTGIDVTGLECLDVGQSTGGFTDVLLKRKAARVVGIDVGHGQLHPSLRGDARVQALEGINARELTARLLGASMPAKGFDLIVADLSFISLSKVVAAWPGLLAARSNVLALVKPQFEVGKQGIGKGGLVKSDTAYPMVETTVRQAVEAAGMKVVDYFQSAITGGDGNREFFVWAQPEPDRLHEPL